MILKPGDYVYVDPDAFYYVAAVDNLLAGVHAYDLDSKKTRYVRYSEILSLAPPPCAHCNQRKEAHPGDECLFQSTRYAPAGPPEICSTCGGIGYTTHLGPQAIRACGDCAA